MKDNKILTVVIIINIMLVFIMISFVIYNAYRLYRFKKCYNSEFTLKYCELYRDY